MNLNKVGARLLFAAFAVFLVVGNAAAQLAPSLGTAATFAVLAGSTVTNTGASVISGDVGVSPGTAVTGFPPGLVEPPSAIHSADGPAGAAQADLITAYNEAAGQAAHTVAAELGGQTLVPGVYTCAAGAFDITGILTLDGGNNPNAVFIFQTASTLITAAGAPGAPASQVVLINGAAPGNVFWQVGSSATLGTYSSFQGDILALTSISLKTGATTTGHVLARNGAVTLDTNAVTILGSIRIWKTTIGGDGTFAFTSNFGLISLTTIGGLGFQEFDGLAPADNYSVSEPATSGWTLTSVTCTRGTPAAIIVVAGANTSCYFTNTQLLPAPTGSITVVKNAIGGDGTFAFSSSFGLTYLTTNGGAATQAFNGLAAGSYSLAETAQSGWNQTSATCDNGTPTAIVVVAGATTTCTITNTIAAPAAPNLVIAKSHVGNFVYGDTGDTYALTVSNSGQSSTNGVVTVTDALPAGLTATAIGGSGWGCTLTPLTCQRSDLLGAGASYPAITVTVNVANNSSALNPVAGGPGFQTGDILLSIADGSVQWRHHDFGLVELLPASAGEAKGMGFDSSGNLYVTHWYGAGLSGNDVEVFNHLGNPTGMFGGGFNCNPTSISFDNSGNAYVGQADCSTQALKFDSLGNPLAQYTVAVENRGSEHVVLDPNQCTMYYTSEGGDVKQFNVCSNTQMPNFNAAPLPDAVEGGQQFSPLPGGGMLVADFSVIARLDASGNLVTTYGAGGHCWLGMALDPDGVSFWASDWCSSVVTRFDMATGNVIDTYVADATGFVVKQICIPINISNTTVTTVTNTATVAGGGESNTASDVTTIDPPAPVASTPTTGVVNAASYAPVVAAGSIASLFGSGLSNGQAIASGAPLPDSLASSFLEIGSQMAPLLSASPNRVNTQIPWVLAGQSQAMVIGTVGAVVSFVPTVTIAPFAPGIFTIGGAVSGLAPFVPALFTLNDANPSQGLVTIAGTQVLAPPSGAVGTPVAPGAFVSIYCTGLGAVTNQPATGAAALASPLSATITAPTVTIGGLQAPVSFSGLAPGAVGLYLVTVQVPMGTPTGGAEPVVLAIGGVISNTVMIAVQ